MVNLTDQFLAKARPALEKIPEPGDSTGRWFAFDDGGVECEVGEFLYGFVRMTKPKVILETGTYSGISSMYMAEAMKDNGFGDITTLEIDEFHKNRAEKLWQAVGLSHVKCVLTKSLDYEPKTEYDMLFLDSEPEFRFQELLKFYPSLKEGGYAFIHDLHRHLSQHDNEKFFGWPYGQLPEELLYKFKSDQLRPFSFGTPRGLTGFYKPGKEDFKWN